MGTLYSGNERYTSEAFEIYNQAIKVLSPVIAKARQDGFSVREICGLLHTVIGDIETELILDIAEICMNEND